MTAVVVLLVGALAVCVAVPLVTFAAVLLGMVIHVVVSFVVAVLSTIANWTRT